MHDGSCDDRDGLSCLEHAGLVLLDDRELISHN